MIEKLRHNPTVVDLFAGCGGLSLGLERAGFFPLYVNELNADARETYLINRDHSHPHLRKSFHSGDIKKVVSDDAFADDLFTGWKATFGRDFRKDRVDLVVGGPPCQGFSGIGLRRSYSVEKKQLPSNHLFQDMAFFVHKIQPKAFIFENVEGLLRSRWTKEGSKGEIFHDVLTAFQSLEGYNVRYKLVHAKQYGVPQNRPRVLVVGVHENFALPASDDPYADAVTAGFLPEGDGGYGNLDEVLGDLVDPEFEYGGQTSRYVNPAKGQWAQYFRTDRDGKVLRKNAPLSEQEYSKHSPSVQKRFQAMIDSGGEIPAEMRTKKFAQRLLPKKWGEQGPSITATSLPDDFVHFAQARTPTVREWARLQTFPDWYQFAGKRTTGGLRRAGNPRENLFDREVPKYTQIGNAVPVKMAEAVGSHLARLLNK